MTNIKLHAKIFQLIFLFVIFQRSEALYAENGTVINLTPSNFDQLVLKSDEVWIVEFYAPWCMYCQNIVPEIEKTADALRGIVKVGVINADNYKELPGRYGVRGLPTIKIFGSNKMEPEDYDEAKNTKQLIEASLRTIKYQILSRLTLKDQEHFLESESESLDVVELTDNNFDELVMDSNDNWMVLFYAQWCGHCKTLKPHWESAARILKGKVKFGKLDVSINKIKGEEFDVTAYPAIKLFPSDKNQRYVDYNGGRKTKDIIEWLNEKLEDEEKPLPMIYEILNEKSLIRACEKKDFCILVFLPKLLECPSSCRHGYIDMLNTLANKFKEQNWGWVWSESDDQPDLQRVLNIGPSGFPTLVAASYKEILYAVLNGPFSEEGIHNFLINLAHEKVMTYTINTDSLPDIYAIPPWSGTDDEIDTGERWKDEL